jgi:RimJ/RimL family protein N-acetyltransferase
MQDLRTDRVLPWALEARDDAFAQLGLSELISVIHPENHRSQRVATKLGMCRARTIENRLLGREVDVWELTAAENG